MKINILKDVSHRISSGSSIDYKKGTTPDVPKAIAEQRIESKHAEAYTAPRESGQTQKKET